MLSVVIEFVKTTPRSYILKGVFYMYLLSLLLNSPVEHVDKNYDVQSTYTFVLVF